MEVVKVAAQQRRETGKNAARRLRRAGKLPAVLYGHGDAESLTIGQDILEEIRLSEAGENTILELVIEGERPTTYNAILREVQIDPLSRAPMHVDLYRIRMDEAIRVSVPLEFVNEPEDRLKIAQHMLSLLLREVEVECLPRDIPETITVDLEALEIGEVIRAEAVPLPRGVTLLTDPEEPLVTTEMIREAMVEEVVAEEGEAAEVAKGKEAATEEAETED